MEMSDRVKEVRAAKDMSQSEFAKLLGIGQSTLGMMEVSKRKISERHIKSICSICNVNEHWLRTGEGEMFVESAHTVIDQLVDEYSLDNLDKQLLLTYLELSPANRQALKTYLTSFSAKLSRNDVVQDPIEQKLDEYRQELEAEQRAQLVCEDSDEKKNGTK